MTSAFVEYMEDNAYNTAVRDLCIPRRDSQKIAMHELFDMVTGSETGAIIASTLVMPNDDTKSDQKNKYFASTASQWFRDNQHSLYQNAEISKTWSVPLSALIAFVVGLICYLIVQWTYADEKFDDHIHDLNFMVKTQKKLAKGRKLDNPKEDKVKMEKITKGYGNVDVSDYPDITAIFVEIKKLQGSSLKYDGTDKVDMTKVEQLVQRK